MSFRRTFLPIALALAVLAPAFGQDAAQGKTLSLTLSDVITRSLQKNIALQAAIVSPEISQAAVTQAQEKYIPTFTFSWQDQYNKSAAYSWLDATGAQNITKGQNYSGQVSEALPTGGTFGISVTGSTTDTNKKAQTINPSYQGQLAFNYTQPLLQGFGPSIANYNIIVARKNLDISDTTLEKTVQDTVYNAAQLYWNLVYAIENYKVQQLALQLAKDQLTLNQRSVEIGTLSPLDLMSAQAEVATREANIIAADASIKNAEDQLKILINLSDEEEKGLRSVVALDKPSLEEQKADVDEALALAMAKRTDLRIAHMGLDLNNLGLSYTKNQLLPNLSLTASFFGPGVSGTQILYSGNPLDGIVLGTVPGTGSQALKDAFSFKYPNWSIRFNLNIPLSNLISRAAYTQSKLALDQALLNLKNTEKQVLLEIRTAVRTLQTTYKQVVAYKVARELAEQKLSAEEERLRVGLSTNYLVLQYQRDLTTARVSELQAIISYNLAQVALDRSTGTILEKRKIKVDDILK